MAFRLNNRLDLIMTEPSQATPDPSAAKSPVLVPRVSIDWYRATPWWRLISQSIAISWRTSHILLCAAALLLTQLGINFSHWLFASDTQAFAVQWLQPASFKPALTPLVERSQNSLNTWVAPAPDGFLDVWQKYATPSYSLLQDLSLRRLATAVADTLWIVAIWAIVGGLLARRSVQELGLRITAPWVDSVRWVRTRWASIAWAVLMPLSLVLALCLIPWCIGWIANLTWIGSGLATLLMIPIVLLGIGLGWVCAISLFGFSFSTVAIVTENQADAFDGMSRASAYTFQRPATLIVGVLVAQWLGYFAGSIVSIVLYTGTTLVAKAFGASSRLPLGSPEAWLAPVLQGIGPLLLTAYGFSFFWTASTALYLILRKEIDHAEYDSISMPNDENPKPLPQLPPIAQDVP